VWIVALFLKVHNKAQIPLSVPAQYFVKQRLLRYLYKIRIPAAAQFIELHSPNLFLGGSSTPLSATTQRNLHEHYKDNIQKTSLINRDLTAWLTGLS